MLTDARTLVVVIRGARERTLDACRALVEAQVAPGLVRVIEAEPFEEALRRCYGAGLESGAAWMMTLDGDVLLRPGAVREFLSAAEAAGGACLQLEGRIFDKLSGTHRNAGHRIYRVRHLKRALACIPRDGEVIRPETETLRRMEAQGFPSLRLEPTFGIHDFEQHYEDLYRKAYVHAHKHAQWTARFITRWRELAPRDPDFRITLRGLCDGLQAEEEPRIRRSSWIDAGRRATAALGLAEKAPLPAGWSAGALVETVLAEAAPPPAPAEPGPPTRQGTWLGAARAAQRRLGWARCGPYLVGAALARFGSRLKSMVE